MTEGTGFPRRLRRAWNSPWHLLGAAAAACALYGCMGGTGTDTENGVYVSAQVVDSSGEPVANVDVSILDLSARIDSTQSSPLYQDAMLTTDDSGRVNFFLKKNGAYMAAGKRGDSVLFIDTLKTKVPTGTPQNPGGLGNPTFLVETPIAAKGKVRMNSGLQIDTGRVMLRGTKLISGLKDSGSYDLGWLPPGAQKTAVTIVYQGRKREARFVKVSAKGNQVTVHASTLAGPCLSDSTGPVVAARVHSGSLSTKADVARIAGKSCAYRVGALVRVIEVDSTGAFVRTRGDFVIPSADAPKIWEGVATGGLGKLSAAGIASADVDSSAVPTACIEPEKTSNDGLNGRATLRLSNRDIVVDDFKSGKGCLQ